MKSPARLFVDPHRFQLAEQSGELALLPDEENRLVNVLRLPVESPVVLLDGQGRHTFMILQERTRGGWSLRWQSHSIPAESTNPALLHVTLLQGVLKADKMDWIVQKATELGVHRIIPVHCHYSIPGWSPAQATNRIERWQRIAQSAAQQCKRLDMPTIEAVLPWESAFAWPAGQRILCWEGPAQVRIADALNEGAGQDIAIFVGPEGGFSEDEIAAARLQNWLFCRLGPWILRAETAAIAAIAIVSHLGPNAVGSRLRGY